MKTKINNDNFRNIIINLISSMIFQIILLVISSSGIIFTVKKIFNSLRNNNVTISIFTLIMLIISCIVITITIYMLFKNISAKIKKKKNDFSDVQDYYFSDYEKQITIYNNGTGIIMHKFNVIANNTTKLQQIRRKLNIEDGNKESKFPSLKTMMETSKSDRFQDFGFWYKSDDNIVSEVKEYYWDRKSSNENKKVKNNPQEIRWIFKIDKSRLKKNKPYEICYVVSVPGLAALQNGNLNKALLNDSIDENSSSNMHIDHKIQNLKYTISFEDGVCIDTPPKCKCIISEQDGLKTLDVSGIEEYNLLYTKYIFCIDNPIFGSDIEISWKYNTI